MTDYPKGMLPAVARHMEIFTPHALRRMLEIEKKQTRFVHYTSADVGLKIITTRQIWMRQASCMNDYSEIQHGLECLRRAWHGSHGQRLQAFLNGLFPGVVKEITDSFDAFNNALRFDTYVTSLSEHAPSPEHADEDRFGRLSMWRAYGGDVGVALVVKQDPFWTTDQSLGLFSTPVAYLDEEAFETEFGAIVTTMEANAEFLKQIGKDWTRHSVVMAFSSAAVATKHPGFREEREWRIVRTPNFPLPCPLEKSVQTIRGVPQSVLLLALKDRPPGLTGIEPAALLDRVIIGPTAYPMPIYSTYIAALAEVGVTDASSKVKISFLPLRT